MAEDFWCKIAQRKLRKGEVFTETPYIVHVYYTRTLYKIKQREQAPCFRAAALTVVRLDTASRHSVHSIAVDDIVSRCPGDMTNITGSYIGYTLRSSCDAKVRQKAQRRAPRLWIP